MHDCRHVLLSNPMLLLLLLLLPSAVVGSGLRGGQISCRPDQEGQHIRERISVGITANCRCIGGFLENCQIAGPMCERRLRGCHFAERSPDGVCQTVCRGCVVNGTKVESGATWNDDFSDPCVKSHCFSGVLTQTEAKCPPLTCADPVRNPGECCPSCPAAESVSTRTGRKISRCFRAGEPFADGETKPDPLDPCNECSCDRSGSLTCERRACPVLPCPKRLQKTARGRCCPECVRRHEADVASFGGKCFFQNRLHRPGESFAPDNCTNCTCNPSGDGGVICRRTTCPPLPCAEAEQVQDPDSCCPICPNSVVSHNAVASLPAQRPQHCEHEGVRYSDGQVWETKCARCNCSNGETQCAKNECPKLNCLGGSRPVGPKDGKCCAECQSSREEGVCTVFGDPHYRTFDGSIFNFQGSCKYLLASDCQHGVGNGVSNASAPLADPSFSIRIINDARDSMAFSWTRTVTVRVAAGGGDARHKVTLMQNKKVKVDGKRVDLPYIKMGHFSVWEDGGYTVILRLKNGIKLRWDGVSFLELTVPDKYRGRLCGLCGNYNGNPSDDFYGRDGGVHPDGQSFGDTWRVGGTRACSVLPRDMPKSYEPQCSQSWESKIKSDRNCNALNSTLFHSCRALVDHGYYYNACRLDMCECPGDQCHCEVLTAYARQCERAGVIVPNWRNATGCLNVSSFQWTSHHHRQDNATSPHENEVRPISQSSNEVDSLESRVKKSSPPLPYATLHGVEGRPREAKTPEEEDRIGEFLPGCTLANAKFCQPAGVRGGADKVTKGGKRQKKKSKAERRAERKARKRLERKRMKKIERQLMRSHRRRRPRNRRRRKKKGKKSKKKKKGASKTTMRPESRMALSALISSPSDDQSIEHLGDEDEQETETLFDRRDFDAAVREARRRAPTRQGRRRVPLPLKEGDALKGSSGEVLRVLTKRDFKRRRRRRRRRKWTRNQ